MKILYNSYDSKIKYDIIKLELTHRYILLRGKPMINQLLACEKEYKKQFSEYSECANYILFKDDILPDMYSHNCYLVKNKKSVEKMATMLNGMIEERKKSGESFLKVEIDFPLNKEIYAKLSVQPEISYFHYMGQEVKNLINPVANENSVIKKANILKILNDGIYIDIETNKNAMGEDFAKRRIDRKKLVYEDPLRLLDLYVCYHNDIPIGNCELLMVDTVGKIEDFDIIEAYQRKGYGTSLLNFVMDEAIVEGAEYIYLLTDAEDTVKEMYKKFGLEILLTRTELYFGLK
jgi:spore maturation protein CgeE